MLGMHRIVLGHVCDEEVCSGGRLCRQEAEGVANSKHGAEDQHLAKTRVNG